MSKNKTRKNCKKGGKAIASGGYGCVFAPAIKCKNSTKRENNKISKLMTSRHAKEEYDEINNIKKKLDDIPNYKDYFLVYDVTLCEPDKLTKEDLEMFDNKCSALPKDKITKKNINQKLDEIMSLNVPNGGSPIDDFIYNNGSFNKIYMIHNKLVLLLKNGIIPMNKRNIYHCDIKDSNVLISEDKFVRLIDWGLSVDYKPNDSDIFPRNWRNRPLQFNVPFSVIIFTDAFYQKYSNYLKDGGQVNEASIKPFVADYLNFWMKERGAGHYKFINEIVFKLSSHKLTSVSEDDKPVYTETTITIPLIVDYITDILVHYTRFKKNGELNLREYLNEVFIKIIDIWGFVTIYYPLLETLYNNYNNLTDNENKVYNHLCYLFYNHLYEPRHEPNNLEKLFKDLHILGNLIKKCINDEGSYRNSETSSKKSSRKKSSIFKRKSAIKRFKNPFLLSIK